MATSEQQFLPGKFPEGFAWSTASSSYQIEGAWNADGKGESIWDRFSHDKGNILNGDNGDVACDSYHNIHEDIEIMRGLGTTHYRFSISWPRILPNGSATKVNSAGIAYYNRLIDALVAVNISPMVTLYHWDLPQVLQDQGGWTNPNIVQSFVDYAEVCFRHFGDKVSLWVTFNEPTVFVWFGYGSGIHAPGIKDPIKSTWLAGHHVIQAHAQTYRLYHQNYNSNKKGELGIALNSDFAEPKDLQNAEHRDCSERLMNIKLGWFANPVFGDGDYPQELKTFLKDLCSSLGESNCLPTFTPEEIKLNKGSADFYGLNHYTTRLVSPKKINLEEMKEGKLHGMIDIAEETNPDWPTAASSWLQEVPWGIRKNLQWIKKSYGNPKVFVTENGTSDDGQKLDDDDRIRYFRGYISQVLKAIQLDGCQVVGYTAWSLLDNFEWDSGYSEHFGLYSVDFSDPQRKRTAKKSAAFYAEIIKNNGLLAGP